MVSCRVIDLATETEMFIFRFFLFCAAMKNKKSNARNAMTEAEKRERRALERKLSEMEEELKVSIDF